MSHYFSFAMTLAAALGIATVGWGQAGGGGGGGAGGAGAGGGDAAGSAAGAGGVGGGATAGAGANTADTAGPAGAAGTSARIGRAGAAGTSGTAGTATGVGRAGVTGAAGVRGGAGAAGAAGRGTTGFNSNGNISQTPFFSDRGVRQQLNMNDNQFNTLNRAYQNAYGNYNRGLNNLNSNLTPQQRAAHLQNLENDFYSGFNRSLDTTFNDPQTRTRFDQLSRQFQGFNAFNTPAIQSQLNLTPQQQTQIRQLASQWRQQLQQNEGAGTNGNVSQAKWNAMMSKYYDELNGILTPQQQQTWSQLTGQRYNFPSNLYMNNMSGGSGNLASRPIAPNTEPRFFPTNGTTANGTTSTHTNGTSTNNPSSTTTATGTSSTGASGSASGNSSGIGTSGTSTNGTSVNNPGSTTTPTGSSSTGTTGSAGAGTGGTTGGGNSGTSGASGSGS